MNKLQKIIRRVVETFKIYLPIKKKTHTSKDVIISLTSYPARFKNLHIVIRSLLHQSIRAEKIVLYLGKDSNGISLPKRLLKLQKFNFIIKYDYPDIKPHKKYFFSMQEFPEKNIITVDDDLIYDRNLVKDLLNCHEKYPSCVCARRVNLITKKNEVCNMYKDWEWEYKDVLEPSFSLLATGCGGVLYPSNILPPETFDIENIKKYCLDTDDIWLKFMELKNNVKVVFTNSKVIHPLTIRHTQEDSLMQTNTKNENINDINIKNMEKFTGIKLGGVE